MSLKLSAVGQLLDESLARDCAAEICAAADAAGTTVTLDMEDHTTTDSTLRVHADLRCSWPTTGAVLQAYLHRTVDDCRTLGAQGARVRLSGGRVIVTDGPFTETNEVVGGYAQFELKSREEAVQSAVRFMELHKKHWPGWEGETEVRQMFGPEDFGPEGCAPKAEERSPAAVE